MGSITSGGHDSCFARLGCVDTCDAILLALIARWGDSLCLVCPMGKSYDKQTTDWVLCAIAIRDVEDAFVRPG